MTLPEADPQGEVLARELLARLDTDTRTQMRARQGHLFGRISPPDALISDERYDVDLSAPCFTVTWGEQVVTRLPVQLIGTLSAVDGTFLWGHHNPVHRDSPAVTRLAAARADDGLDCLLDIARFLLETNDAVALAQMVTHRLGAIGPYPAPVGSVTAFLAVDAPGRAGLQTQWCTFCGRHDGRLIASPICTLGDHPDCLPVFLEIVAESAPSPVPSGFECVFCGGNEGVVQHRYVGICHACIRAAAAACSR